MKLKWIVILGLGVVTVNACKNKQADYQNIPRPVRVMKVESFGRMQKVYTGVVEAEEYSKLAFKVSGPLIEMNVQEGQKVKKGSVIAAVDPLDYNLQNEANKAAWLTAKSQLERNKRLLAMQAISRQEYEIAEADYIRAQSAYETSSNTLKDTKLVAPFDGFVETRYVENYQKVQPGESIIKLVNPDKLEVGFILPEINVRLTREKMQVEVEFDTYKGQWFKAKVKEFVDASPDGSGIPVRLAIVDTAFARDRMNIYPGFSCRVRLNIDNSFGEGFAVPMSAIFKDPDTGETSVWLYRATQGAVERQPVKVGQVFGTDYVEVMSGLDADDVIVVAGVNYITAGQKVSLVEN